MHFHFQVTYLCGKCVVVYSRHRAGYCSQPAAFLTNHSAPSYIAVPFAHTWDPIRSSFSSPPAKILAVHYIFINLNCNLRVVEHYFKCVWSRLMRRFENKTVFIWYRASGRRRFSSSDFHFKWFWTLFCFTLNLTRIKVSLELYLRVQCWQFHCYTSEREFCYCKWDCSLGL